jgi:hypothetical protein
VIRPADLAKLRFDDEGEAYLANDDNDDDDDKVDNGSDCERRYISGLVQCHILCPPLATPFLQYRVKQSGQSKMEKAISPMCAKCADTMNKTPCCHSESERAMVGVWCLAEIGYAVTQLGYKILATYEILAYRHRAPLFKQLLEMLAKCKIQYTGYPTRAAAATPESRRAYVDSINEVMGWKKGVDRNYMDPDVDEISDNPAQRSFFKLLSNSLLDKC